MTVIEGKQHRIPLVDRVPEQTHYRDVGCAVSPSCLRCPLERCIYDEPEAHLDEQRRRDEQIYRMYRERGPDIRALAVHFGVSRRTIHRVVQRMRQQPPTERTVDMR